MKVIEFDSSSAAGDSDLAIEIDQAKHRNRARLGETLRSYGTLAVGTLSRSLKTCY